MLRFAVLFSLSLLWGLQIILAQHSPDSPPTHSNSDERSIDILDDVRQAQRNLQLPTKDFSPGTVTPRVIHDFQELNSNGFEIQMPSRGMAPSPTIYEGMAFVSGGFGSRQFYAFDAQSGRTRWAIDLSDDGPSAGVVSDGTLVFNTESCTLFAIEAESGKMKWSYYLGDPLMSTPTVANGLVFTAYPAPSNRGSQQQQQQSPIFQDLNRPEIDALHTSATLKDRFSHILAAFDLHTGEIVWQKWIDGDVMSAPVAEEDELYVTTFPGTVFRFEQETGEILAATAQQATSAPVLAGDLMLVSQRADLNHEVREQLSMLDRRSGSLEGQSYTRSAPYLDAQIQQRSTFSQQAKAYDAGNGFGGGAPANSGWQYAAQNIGQHSVSSLQAYQGSRILSLDKYLYATMGNELVCTHATTGKLVWKQNIMGDLEEVGGHLATPPLEAGGNILICTIQGELLLFKAKTGKLIYQHATHEEVRAQPVVDQGRIFLTTMSGKFLCIDTGKEELNGWPTWGGNAAHNNRNE